MSRISPEAQRRWHSPESRVSREREDQATGARPAGAWRGGWDFWAVRAFLVACTGAVSYTLGPFGLRGLPVAGVGFLIALVVLLAELRLRRAALSGLLGGAFGAVLGVFAALLVTLVISRTDELSVPNVNQLAQALKPAVLPGEPMRVLYFVKARNRTRVWPIWMTARWS